MTGIVLPAFASMTGRGPPTPRRIRSRLGVPPPEDVPRFVRWLRWHRRTRVAAQDAWGACGGRSLTAAEPVALLHRGPDRVVVVLVGRVVDAVAAHAPLPRRCPPWYAARLLAGDGLVRAITAEAATHGLHIVWVRVLLGHHEGPRDFLTQACRVRRTRTATPSG